MSKWGKAYWRDFAERCGATAVYGLITFFTLDASTSIDPEKLWPVVILPVILNALKNLAVNLGGTAPTASVVKVTSTNGGGTP